MAHTRPADRVKIVGKLTSEYSQILTLEAVDFLALLLENFQEARQEILEKRTKRQGELAGGKIPDFLAQTQNIRSSEWSVGPIPHDLQDRRVEITGPVEKKMMINAFNSGAKVFMADLEDALSPTWDNVLQGQINLREAVRGQLKFTNPDGKEYRLHEKTATLMVRPRGWHLTENHILFGEKPVSASLVDFGLTFFHNARELLERGTGPYFYLPKLENHLEARLWNDIFNFSQDALKIPRGSIKVTVLIETILAAFEMEEILYELKDHAAGLNAGRWDYIFSIIKKFNHQDTCVFPDRTQITMTVPFMRAYTQLLVHTCHKRGAHAIGGMAAFIPSRRDTNINEIAIAKVKEDKLREAGDGFDGTWVAHPDLVAVAREIFDSVLKERPHQKMKSRNEKIRIGASDLVQFSIAGGKVTQEGLRNNISVALQYLESWLRGTGAVGIFNLMEDAATAEISRAEIWQWIHHQVSLDNGQKVTAQLYKQLRDEEVEKLGGLKKGRLRQSSEILDNLILSETFTEFLTVPAYQYLE